MASISEDIRSMYTMVPIWEFGVWKAIQSRDYQQTEILLGEFLENEFTTAEQWKEIYWGGILSGVPSFKGALKKEEWEESALPAIARAVRNAASDEILHDIYSSLQKEDLEKLRALMLSVVAEADAKKHTAANTPQTEPQVVFSQPPSQDAPQNIPPEIDQTTPPAPPEQAHPQSQPTPPPQPTQKEESADLLSPGFRGQPITPQSPPQPAPFVLHKETEIQPLASGGTAPLSRPQFFKSTAEKKTQEAPSTARLEIGADATPDAKQAGQTKKEIPKVVNYTGPAIKADPFKRPEAKQKPAPKTEQAPPQPPREVSPDNIVNLKDLPK